MIRRPAFRILWLFCAVLQILGPEAAAWADGRLDAASHSPRAANHVEDHTHPQCPPVHPVDCALCQFLSTPAAVAQRPTLEWQRHERSLPIAPRVVALRVAIRFARPPSRAPPALV